MKSFAIIPIPTGAGPFDSSNSISASSESLYASGTFGGFRYGEAGPCFDFELSRSFGGDTIPFGCAETSFLFGGGALELLRGFSDISARLGGGAFRMGAEGGLGGFLD